VGHRHPEIVLVVEKDTVEEFAWELARRIGISVIILGGQPAVISTEFFARALRAAHRGKVRLAAYVDYDPAGWVIAKAFRDQLALFGVEAEDPRYLVLPSRFTADERSQVCIPLHSSSSSGPAAQEAWMRRTGGVDGKPLGIHLDHLRPLERVVAAFAEVTGLRMLQGR